jgi:excinuclease ABC subunit A
MQRTAAVDPRLVLTFPVELPANSSRAEVEQWLSAVRRAKPIWRRK